METLVQACGRCHEDHQPMMTICIRVSIWQSSPGAIVSCCRTCLINVIDINDGGWTCSYTRMPDKIDYPYTLKYYMPCSTPSLRECLCAWTLPRQWATWGHDIRLWTGSPFDLRVQMVGRVSAVTGFPSMGLLTIIVCRLQQVMQHHLNGLLHYCIIYIANALEILQSYTKPSI